MSEDRFPHTRIDTIQSMLRSDRWDELHHMVMETYWEPLQIYFRGSSFRHSKLGEAEEVVDGFLAWWCEHQYIERWDPERQRLRHFLLNGFRKFLLQQIRKSAAWNRRGHIDDDLPTEQDMAHEFDRLFVNTLIRRAMVNAEEMCKKKNLEQHWTVFAEKTMEGLRLREIGERHGISRERAEVMAKAGKRYFVRAMKSEVERQLSNREHAHQDMLREEIDDYLRICSL